MTAGDNGRSPDAPPPRSDEDLSDADLTLSDADQTLSDADQTFSDADQTLSDRDQQSSDEDQAASDRAHDAGADHAAYERTTADRDETSRERRVVEGLREETASHRDTVARERDEFAAQRDGEALLRDQRAQELDSSDELYDRHTLRVQELRARAAQARKRARDDRQRAAEDREQARRDRAKAAAERELAAHERRRAGIDELTAARRRGVGLEDLQNEIDRARRTEGGLVAAFVDVDGLKAVNDTWGHTAGDALLREVADGLRRHVRSYDLVVRFGGDEFLCALPGVTVPEARTRLLALVAELRVAKVPGSVTFGLAELRDGDSPDSLIDRADRHLLATRRCRPRAAV